MRIYRGIHIDFVSLDVGTRAGEFIATVGGKVVYKKSLNSMEKYIDKVENSTFTKFTAWIRSHSRCMGLGARSGQDKFIKIEVTGVEQERYGYGSQRGGIKRFKFISTPPVMYYTDVYAYDAANARAYDAAEKYRRETERIDGQRRKKQDELDESVKKLKPEDYVK